MKSKMHCSITFFLCLLTVISFVWCLTTMLLLLVMWILRSKLLGRENYQSFSVATFPSEDIFLMHFDSLSLIEVTCFSNVLSPAILTYFARESFNEWPTSCFTCVNSDYFLMLNGGPHQCDQIKIAKCLSKLPKNVFTRKMNDFDIFTKIA